ncbi:MAG: hypothetical protein JXB30_11875 [Anaerolineae bacterium]|nr:hypothetical protein [Anaerolineae bacterium]
MQITADFLSLLAQALLVIALPIVIAAGIQHLRVMTKQLRSQMDQERQQAIDRAVSIAVQLAERAGLVEKLISSEKRKHAIELAEEFLAERGVTLDLDKLVTLIEAEVQKQFHSPTPPADTPQARQELIDGAVNSAIMAAQQSGLAGLIKDIGTEKKAYAMRMATEYLAQHGIGINEQLLSGLIEAQLFSMTINEQVSSGTLSGSTPVGGTGVAGAPPG